MGNVTLVKEKVIFALSLLWIVAISVTLTVFLSIPLFRLEISWSNLTAVSGLSADQLMHNFYQLMAYLLNPFIPHLRMTNFPDSASGLKHFSEVKQLFLFAVGVSLVLIPAFVRFTRSKLYLLFRRGILVAMLVPVVLAIFAFVVGFDNFFILFHEVLFRDNTWLFDPTVDPIINVLPDQYFMHSFILFALLYEGILGAFLLLSMRFRRKNYEKTKPAP